MRRVGPLMAEVIDPESDRFTASMVLVHGLWERAASWRRFAGYLAHRGWRCTAVERRTDDTALDAHVADLRAVIATFEAPPVVIGHDLGALIAMRCADLTRATVAVAPLVGPPLAAPPEALQRAGSWLARRRGWPLRAPQGRWHKAYPHGELLEPAGLIRQIASQTAVASPVGTEPRAVFAMRDDEVTSAEAAAALAARCGAEHIVLPGGHAALAPPAWEAAVAGVHRWLIQRLGVDLLALYEESMQTE